MAVAAATGAVPAADSRTSLVAPSSGGAPSAAVTRDLRRWSVAAGSAGRRFFCGSVYLETAGGGAGLHRAVSMSVSASSPRGGHLMAPPTSYAVYQGACLPRGKRFLPRAQLGDANPPSEDKPEKNAGRALEDFINGHPRLIASMKLVALVLCTFASYLSAKGDRRVQLLVETSKDAAEVYAFLASVLILLKNVLFPGSKR